jgi:WD40 repeat protein
VRAVAFSPDGLKVLTGCGTAVNPEGYAQMWDVETGEAIGEPWRHSGPVTSVAFHPDGERAVTGSVDGFARVWNVETGTLVGEPWKHEGAVSAVAYSPQGERLVAVSLNLAQIWDVETGTRIGELFGREDTIEEVAFTPAGDEVMLAFSDVDGISGFVKRWDVARPFHPLLPEGRFGRTLDNGQLRDLTNQERIEVWRALDGDTNWSAQFELDELRRWAAFELRSAE